VPQPHKVFRFGDFALDCAQRRLLRGALDIYLPPKTFELLVYLIQNGGRVIEKEELLDTVWSGVNVTENTLAQRIREVREALQDDGSSARLIKTIPRVGYQFVGHVEEEDHSPRESLDVAPKPRVTRAMWPYVVGVGALSVAGMVGAFALSRVNAPIALANQLTERLSSRSSSEAAWGEPGGHRPEIRFSSTTPEESGRSRRWEVRHAKSSSAEGIRACRLMARPSYTRVSGYPMGTEASGSRSSMERACAESSINRITSLPHLP
jgi:DNA-binding winged helix-turn-helix (wHTH) protein